MTRLLVIDCRDSFVYNLVQILRECAQCDFDVVRESELDLDSLSCYDALLLSPGPGVPSDYPRLMGALERCAHSHAIMGVCLGLQALVCFFGGSLRQLSRPLHGHQGELLHGGHPLFAGIASGARIGRYHSWVADEESLPQDLEVIGTTIDQEGEYIMALAHRSLPIYAVQFHPESIISEQGALYLRNFLSLI